MNNMSCEFICDGCGKRVKGSSLNGNWYKPDSWFERSDEDGTQTAWSRNCITKIAEKTGKTNIILPI
jgi:hypothetical protein